MLDRILRFGPEYLFNYPHVVATLSKSTLAQSPRLDIVVGWMSPRPGLGLDRRGRERWADGVARIGLDLLTRCG